MTARLSRTAALLGEPAIARLASCRVLVVGVGGVGGWCAEALARSGVGALVLVDDDAVVESNLNRQCAATLGTMGMPKVDAMRARLASVNPDCRVTALRLRYPDDSIRLGDFDAVADAIDSVASKAALVRAALEGGVPLVSSMGAALRTDPTRVRTSRFEKVVGDGLARALRQRFRKDGWRPGRFDAVWSDESPAPDAGLDNRGSMMPVVATFGMCQAARIIDLLTNEEGDR